MTIMHGRLLILLLINLLGGLIMSCKPKHGNEANEIANASSEVKADLPADFMPFYKRFHEDSLFQLTSIDFPLEGLPDNADPEYIGNDKFFYTSDQWEINRNVFDDKAKYDIQYNNIANVLIEEQITIKQYDLKIIRRFAKNGNSWKLIYYGGLNKYKSNPN